MRKFCKSAFSLICDKDFDKVSADVYSNIVHLKTIS